MKDAFKVFSPRADHRFGARSRTLTVRGSEFHVDNPHQRELQRRPMEPDSAKLGRQHLGCPGLPQQHRRALYRYE